VRPLTGRAAAAGVDERRAVEAAAGGHRMHPRVRRARAYAPCES
jgi:hypothetical protein